MSEHSAKMWSGRFREPLDPLFDHWQRSIKFDRALLAEEIMASKAHARALLAAGVLAGSEYTKIVDGLDGIVSRFIQQPHTLGEQPHTPEPMGSDAEDIHHFVEMKLVEAGRRSGPEAAHGTQPQRADRDGSAAVCAGAHRDTDCASGRVGGRAGRAGKDAS